MPTSDLFVLIFVWIDELLKGHPEILNRPGPQPEITDAELLTLMLVQALSGEISDESWLRKVQRHHADFFPILPERSRYQRRRAILQRAHGLIVERVRIALGEPERLRIVDSAPIPVCRLVRGNRCKTFQKEASWGWSEAQKTWFFGVRLHLMITESGLPAAWDVLTAKRHDRKGLDSLLAGRADLDVYGDAAYNVRSKDREDFQKHGITITAATKSNMEPLTLRQQRTLKRVRFQVEKTIGHLSQVFLIQRTLARKLRTLKQRLSFCLTGFCVGAWINAQLERPVFHIKSLAA